MGKEESKVTKVVREGVVKAYEKGENLVLSRNLCEIFVEG